MDATEIKEALAGHAGQFIRVTWTRPVKTAAAHKGHTVTKTVTATVRSGIDYANLAQNEDRETGPLPWGTWLVFPYIIGHKGTDYVRLYRHEDGAMVATFTIDGHHATREAVDALLTPGDRNRDRGGPTETFTVKAENVVSIG